MPQAARVDIKTNGQTLVVDFIAPGSATESFYTDAALTASVTLPVTVGSDTTYYTGNFGPYTVSAKQLDGSELWGRVERIAPDQTTIIEPLPTQAQVASDLKARDALMPTAAIAETYPRATAFGNNVAILTSGTLHLAAIALTAGTTITSATWASATTAAASPTNWWFALYDSSLNLLRQTADQTSTAWAANSLKTVAFTTPYTTTYSGLHYLGIMMAAATPVSLACNSSLNVVINIPPPKLSGSSTGSLTTTAPATAAAISSSTAYPYAYVS